MLQMSTLQPALQFMIQNDLHQDIGQLWNTELELNIFFHTPAFKPLLLETILFLYRGEEGGRKERSGKQSNCNFYATPTSWSFCGRTRGIIIPILMMRLKLLKEWIETIWSFPDQRTSVQWSSDTVSYHHLFFMWWYQHWSLTFAC